MDASVLLYLIDYQSTCGRSRRDFLFFPETAKNCAMERLI